MKRLFLLLVTLLITVSLIASCDFIEGNLNLPSIDGDLGNDGAGENPGETPDENPGETPDENPDGTPDETPDVDPVIPEYLYNDFTSSDKALFTRYIGTVIPFVSNNEYYIEGYYDIADYENGINFYAKGNTEADFDLYVALYVSDGYTLSETYEDSYGDTWYCYVKGDVVVDLSYYVYDGDSWIDVFVYSSLSETPDDGTTPDDGSGYGDGTDSGGDDIVDAWRDQYECITVAEALALCEQFVSSPSSARYYMIVTVVSIDDAKYGQLTVEDETGSIMVYGTRGSDGEQLFEDLASKPSAGDTILIYGTLQNYKGNTKEVQNAWLIDFYSPNGTGGNTGSTGTTQHTYTDFTSGEKALFTEYFGFVIPFIANDEYYVEEYTYDDELGINFYTYGNTSAEFDTYRNSLTGFVLTDTYEDDYGDTWYCYDKGEVYIDVAYYYTDDGYVIDLYVFVYSDGTGDTGDGSTTTPDNVITNDGKGLPSDSDGVYDVDFTLGTPVKNVTEQGYYVDGCPTVGSPAVLVIPVQFSDALAASKGYTVDAIKNAFLKDGDTDYYSVYDYYYISSYGQLTLDITVLDSWFTPQYSSSYYADYEIDGYLMGDQLIMDEALAYLDKTMDLSKFDSDNNGIIDAVVLVNTLDVGDDDFHWAYRYWNYYVDDEGYYYEYDGVSANDYLWASYQFLHESYDEDGNAAYGNESGMDTYTYIHEFGHILGADDYYDTAYKNDPMGGFDIMDSMKGDHNAYTKFNLGWITTSRLVVTNTAVTLTLEDFSKSGDTIILANNWDPKLGAYQEYYIIAYYTNNGLNAEDNGYFLRDGIVVYHVNASLYSETYDGEVFYDVYNNNTDSSDEYGTTDNLIEYVLTSGETYTYIAGDTLPAVTLDGGDALGYTFTVDSIDTDTASVTISKK